MLDAHRIASVPEAGETPAAFAAFTAYRQMESTKRTLAAVAHETGRADSTIKRWSAKHGWAQRVRDYDAGKEKANSEVEEAVAMASAHRHINQAQRLQDIAMGEITRLAEFSQSSEIPLLRPADAIKMVEVGFKMERLASGETTEKTDQLTATRPLTEAEIAQYNQYLDGKAQGKDDDLDVDLG